MTNNNQDDANSRGDAQSGSTFITASAWILLIANLATTPIWSSTISQDPAAILGGTTGRAIVFPLLVVALFQISSQNRNTRSRLLIFNWTSLLVLVVGISNILTIGDRLVQRHLNQVQGECLAFYGQEIGPSVSVSDIANFCMCFADAWKRDLEIEDKRERYSQNPNAPWITERSRAFLGNCGGGSIGLRSTVDNFTNELPLKLFEGVHLVKVDSSENQLLMELQLDGQEVELPNREPFTNLWSQSITEMLCAEPKFRSLLDFGVTIYTEFTDLNANALMDMELNSSDCKAAEYVSFPSMRQF